MRRRFFCLPLVCCIAWPVFGPLRPCSAEEPKSRLVLGRDFIELLNDGKFAQAAERFDKTMTEVMPPEKLGEIWQELQRKSGGYKNIRRVGTERQGEYHVVLLDVLFASSAITFRLVFDKENRIAGLWLAPTTQPGQEKETGYTLPDYEKPDAYSELDVEVGDDPWKLRGKLTIPAQRMLCPVVVLVHGSGPHDEDETIGPNKIFRDLAGGLSSSGVAVLRYSKRTHAYRLRLAAQPNITIREEVIDDAVAAVRLLRGYDGIDKDRIFVLGHSLGGTLAPQIAAEAGDVAGVILLAGSARDCCDVVLEQLAYISSIQGPGRKQNLAMYEDARKKIEGFRAGELPATEMILGVPLSYWNELSFAAAESLKFATELKCPMLIVGGGRDYQVSRKDFDVYREALKSKKGVTFQWYEDMSHLMFRGKGKSKPAEYAKPGHVDVEVITDLANWIKRRGD